MNVTEIFVEAVKLSKNKCSVQLLDYQPIGIVAPSLFSTHAHKLLRKLRRMETKTLEDFDAYVDYYGRRPSNSCGPHGMTDAERTAVEHGISVFAIAWTTEVNELKRNYAAEFCFKKDSQANEHCTAISAYLLERLQKFTNFSLAMKSQRENHNINPFNMYKNTTSLTSWSISKPKTNETVVTSSNQSSFMRRMLSSSIVNARPVQSTTPAPEPSSALDNFATRFSAEVAAPKKLKEYDAFAVKHKASLLAESKQLSEKYSEDLQTAMSVEKTVVGVFDMLNQFIGLLQEQEEVIVDVHDSSKIASQHVHETDDQLLLTIERSKNYQRSTVMVVVILAIFLLVLDAMTP